MTLECGEKIRVTPNKEFEEKCSKEVIYVDYERIVHILNEGSKIFIDDGLICLVVESKGMFYYP